MRFPIELKAFCKGFYPPAASRRQAIVARFLQGVNASDQGSPVEAEARPPDHPTKARHPLVHAHLPEGAGEENDSRKGSGP